MTTQPIEAIGALLPPLLRTFDHVVWVQRHLFPPRAAELAERLAPDAPALAEPLAVVEASTCADDVRFIRDRLVDVTRQTLEMVNAFVEAARAGTEPFDLYRALRRFSRAQEALYPLAPVFDPVSRWFLEPAMRSDDALVARLRAAALRDDHTRTGVGHVSNERNARGGFSLYVPEQWDRQTPMPVVVALHGGHGHGRDFLWSWLTDARSRGVLLLSPTSRERTWSIMGGEDIDAEPLREMVEAVGARYAIDRSRVLLTGMSDGATYALLCGLRAGMPFTHLAPACGVLHPMLLATGDLARARELPVYLIHGALDWMFPLYTAHLARETLQAAGAKLVYREIADLSHTYPRDENPRILDWLIYSKAP